MSTPTEYTFDKSVRLPSAFNARLAQLLGARSLGSSTPDADRVTVYVSEPLDAQELAQLAQLVQAWEDPPYWLELERTENHSMRSAKTSDPAVSTFLETFIMSPYLEDDGGVVMGSIKTVVRCWTADLAWMAAWDPAAAPIHVDVQLYCGTLQRTLASATLDISADLEAAWRSLAGAGAGAGDPPPVYKSVQLYGLKDCNPSSDRVWHLQGAVSNANVTINLNGLQRLFYHVVLPM